MRVTIIGKSPSWPDAGGACSGYLVEHGGTRLLLDCGSGVFARLRQVRDYTSVDAVLITHAHPDHVLDLIPYACALTYGPRAGRARPALQLPPGAREVLARVMTAFDGPELLEDAFAVTEYDPAAGLEVGPLRIAFRAVEHFVPTFAVAIDAGGARFVFGADTGPAPGLAELARGADLLMAEATLTEPREGHLTAAQAGRLAASARVGRLVLTHISDELDAAAQQREAEAAFGGPVELAAAGAVYELGGATRPGAARP